MQIDLAAETVELANSLATETKDAASVIAEALPQLAWQRQGVAAAQEGIEAYKAGRHSPWDEFAAEFAAKHGITVDS